MPRYNVEHNGKWACFSSICDGFVTEFMNKSEYEQWRMSEYGNENFKPVEECNQITLEEAVSAIRLNRTHDEAIECLYECGLLKEFCDNIMHDVEMKTRCPIKKDNGTYECPNCYSVVKKKQKICKDDTCCIEFIWR